MATRRQQTSCLLFYKRYVYAWGMDALEKAIINVGSTAELARRVGVVPMAITQWKRRQQVPPERCLAVEAATGGAITRYDLRPDVFGDAPTRSQEAA